NNKKTDDVKDRISKHQRELVLDETSFHSYIQNESDQIDQRLLIIKIELVFEFFWRHRLFSIDNFRFTILENLIPRFSARFPSQRSVSQVLSFFHSLIVVSRHSRESLLSLTMLLHPHQRL